MTVVSEELFGEEEARAGFVEIPRSLSATRRRTLLRLILLDKGEHPVTHMPLHPQAPLDADRWDRYTREFTCGACAHRFVLQHHDKRYPKCDLLSQQAKGAHSATTDTPKWLPACTAYQPVA